MAARLRSIRTASGTFGTAITTLAIDETSVFYKIVSAPPSQQDIVRVRQFLEPNASVRVSPEVQSDNNGDSGYDTGDENPFLAKTARTKGGRRRVHAQIPQLKLIQPAGKWGWAGRTLTDVAVVRKLNDGPFWSTTIRTGEIKGQKVTFINKSWDLSKHSAVAPFRTEIELYNGQKHLKGLQGVVVPTLIGAFATSREMNITMELPHEHFWIEATPDMPIVLKDQIMNTYRTLISKIGVHGNLELRNILIGADLRVTFINFQEGRSLLKDDGWVKKAERAEILAEEYRLRLLLDYDGARSKELANVEERRRYQVAGPSRYSTPVADCPPSGFPDWFAWLAAPCNVPHRHVVPGTKPTVLGRSIEAFLKRVSQLEQQRLAKVTSVSHPMPSANGSSTIHTVAPQKRKQPTHPSIDERNTKKPILSRPEPSNVIIIDEDPRPNPPTAFSNPRLPPIKVRDFAFEPYNGPKGYYVPHPPTEARAELERANYIVRENVEKCRAHQLPHPELLKEYGIRPETVQVQCKRLKRGKSPFVSFGKLKRAGTKVSVGGTVQTPGPELSMETIPSSSGSDSNKRKRSGSGVQDGSTGRRVKWGRTASYDDQTRGVHRPINRERGATTWASSSSGILRHRTPPKTVSHAPSNWPSGDRETSPKLGPIRITKRTSRRAMLGVTCERYRTPQDDVLPSMDDKMQMLLGLGIQSPAPGAALPDVDGIDEDDWEGEDETGSRSGPQSTPPSKSWYSLRWPTQKQSPSRKYPSPLVSRDTVSPKLSDCPGSYQSRPSSSLFPGVAFSARVQDVEEEREVEAILTGRPLDGDGVFYPRSSNTHSPANWLTTVFRLLHFN